MATSGNIGAYRHLAKKLGRPDVKFIGLKPGLRGKSAEITVDDLPVTIESQTMVAAAIMGGR